MKKQLFAFQVTGARFLASRFHALLADEMGVGKTVQAIAAVEILRLKTVLVVCPASVRLGWLKELNDCLGSSYGWRIISYNGATSPSILRDLAPRYDALILDECQMVKTPASQRCQAIFGKDGLARRARYVWALSGTPLLNRPVEAWPLLKSLHPGFAAEAHTTYVNRYCGAFFDGFALNTRGASNLAELASRLEGFMLRRTKAEVLPDLPPLIVSHVPLDVSSSAMAAVFAEEESIGAREAKLSPSQENYSQLGDISRLLRLTGEAKAPAAAAFILDLLESTDKVVVFARHRAVVKALEEALAKRNVRSVTYIGGMSDTAKKEAVDKFQGAEARVFIGNIQAAGVGLNGLTVSACLVFAELDWTPGVMDQAAARCHRLGQKADSVNVYLLHIPASLEAAMLGTLKNKRAVIEALMNDRMLEGLL